MRTDAQRALDRRRFLARWVATHIVPHEAKIRAWLRKYRVSPEDADELIQDAYCAIAQLDAIDHIARPDAYFFSTVRNLLLRRMRRQQVVQIELVAEIESFSDDHQRSPEQEIGIKLDHARVLKMIAALPERCRQAVYLRKVEGWSQREIAEHLQTTEKAVEKQIWLGVKALRTAWDGKEIEDARPIAKRMERRR